MPNPYPGVAGTKRFWLWATLPPSRHKYEGASGTLTLGYGHLTCLRQELTRTRARENITSHSSYVTSASQSGERGEFCHFSKSLLFCDQLRRVRTTRPRVRSCDASVVVPCGDDRARAAAPVLRG